MTIRAVLLDAGNTIVEIDYPFIANAIVAAGGETDADDVRRAERHARVRLDPRLRRGSTEATDIRRLYFGLLLEELRGRQPTEPERVLEAIAGNRHLFWVADPEARRTIDALRVRGLRVGVVSNSDGTVEESLVALGLRDGLDVVIDSGAVGVEKPDPRIFGFALEALGVAADETVYVGDMPAVDLVGAEAAGLDFVLIDPLGLWPSSIDAPRIRRLSDLPVLLDEMR